MFSLEIVVVLLLSLVILLLLVSRKSHKEPSSQHWDSIREETPVTYSTCPLCKSPLLSGEKVRSHLYPGKPDGMMHIFGCPYCNGERIKPGIARICPYCREQLRTQDYVIARVFQKPGKTQVHVLGCTKCREKHLQSE